MTPQTAGFSQPLPPLEPVAEAARKKVAVIGAGVVGLSSAIWLQRAGHSVTVYDPHPPLPGIDYEGACSFGNACTMAYGACLPVAMPGIIREVPGMLLNRAGPLSIFWRDLLQLSPWLLSFLKSSGPADVDRIVALLGSLLRLAEAGHGPLIEEAGLTHLLRRTGCLYLFRDEAQFQAARPALDLRARERVGMEVLDASAVREREPALAPRYAKGVMFLDAYSLDDPHQYLLGLARLFQARGGQFVRGQVAGVGNSAGALVLKGELPATAPVDSVVVASGAWSGRITAALGEPVRLNAERGYHVLFPESVGLLNTPTCYPEFGFYMTPLNEGLRAAGTVELGGLGRPPRPVRTDVIEQVARQLIPGLGPAGRKWLGFRPSMPDSLPVIGPSKVDPRIVYAFGHGHVGLTLGGITGRLVAELVSGTTPSLDLQPFRPGRF